VSLVEDMFDFKEVVEGEIINHSFTITNHTCPKTDLEID